MPLQPDTDDTDAADDACHADGVGGPAGFAALALAYALRAITIALAVMLFWHAWSAP